MTIRNELLENNSSSLSYGLSIQRGLVSGVSVKHNFGRVPSIAVADGFVSVNDSGNLDTGFNATIDDFVTIVSTSVNDVFGGTGATVIRLSGLGANFVEQTEDIQLNGITPVVSTLKYIRMNSVLVVLAGSSKQNNGVITVKQQTNTAIQFAEIEIGNNRTLSSEYTVPFGKQAFVKSGFATISKKQSAVCEIRAKIRLQGSVFQIVEWFSIDSKASSYVRRSFDIPLIAVNAGSDILIEADTDTNGIAVAAGLEILLVDV